jgi:hypothetical protein
MTTFCDGPGSSLFTPLSFRGETVRLAELAKRGISEEMAKVVAHAPSGHGVGWGIPLSVGDVVVIANRPVSVGWRPVTARWLVFMHTSDLRQTEPNADGFISPMRGQGQLAEHAADYVIVYEDGTEERVPVRRRHEIGAFQRRWGENCFQAVAHRKQRPVRASHEQLRQGWGNTQTRVDPADDGPWVNWLWAWENPHPERPVAGVRFEPISGVVVVSAVSAGNVSAQPLRWLRRRKACLRLPAGGAFRPNLDENGLLEQIQLDMGQVISATPRLLYPNKEWGETYNNQLPTRSQREVLVEYTAHPDACFHVVAQDELDAHLIEHVREEYSLEIDMQTAEEVRGQVAATDEDAVTVQGRNLTAGQPEEAKVGVAEVREALNRAPLSRRQTIPLAQVEGKRSDVPLQLVPPSTHRVVIRVLECGTGKLVAVKLHLHGEWGEYLAPTDRHRIPNPAWFEDYSVDFAHQGIHACTYIPGETIVDLPLGRVYLEVSKGFEIRPLRKAVQVTPDTDEIVVEIDRVLPWRERGWVTADTHVHFLSPMSALLEGAGEGVNVVNLLASQWGELMTNVGDFDGQTTWGSKEAGGDGEYLVRVGTENRQHVLGHISLLGYGGRIIAPMTTGGPSESAIGDPIEILLTEWARQCHKQGGLVVLPHFPNPRAEHAASIVHGDIDALEMTAWGDLYSGIDPYSLSDWYRYLNCGYLVAAVGGTDKMSATTAVGTVRTYARIKSGQAFTYGNWMEAIKRAETFVSYGPLLDFAVDGRPMGSKIQMTANGGTVDVTWQVASVTVPMSRVDLVVNGEIRESVSVAPDRASGHWSVKVEKSSWLALLVRGHYADRPEMIAAHSSPVMVELAGSVFLPAADAVTILEQIEGALAYLDTVGTRADDVAYKRMRMVLVAAHRSLHNRMHQQGYYHDHTPVDDHPEHH